MSTISMMMLPEPGHFLPTLRISSALRAMGHSVVYVCVPEFCDIFRDFGFGAKPLLEQLVPEQGSGDLFARRTGTEIGQAIQAKFPGSRSDLVRATAQEVLATDPDLAVIDVIFAQQWGAEFQRELGRPVAALSTSLPGPELPMPEIILCPEAIETPHTRKNVPGRYYVEPSLSPLRRSVEFPWASLDAGRPLVYCSFGTQTLRYVEAPGILRNLIRAFADLPDVQLVIAGGHVYDAVQGAERPSNVLVVRTAPQIELIDRSSLVITHGGLGGIKECIVAGKPMLLVPFHLDQPGNAERVVYHGIGRVCPPAEASPERLAESVGAMLSDTTIAPKVAQMQKVFREMEANGPAAQLLDRLCREPRQVAFATDAAAARAVGIGREI